MKYDLLWAQYDEKRYNTETIRCTTLQYNDDAVIGYERNHNNTMHWPSLGCNRLQYDTR